MDVFPIVKHYALESYPGVGLQLVPFGLHPDTQISTDFVAPQEPPENQRLGETFGPPKPMPGCDFDIPGNGAGARQEELSGIFIQGWQEGMEIGQDGVDWSKAETSHPQGHQGQCQEGLEEQAAL
jgi:hypothetical protein